MGPGCRHLELWGASGERGRSRGAGGTAFNARNGRCPWERKPLLGGHSGLHSPHRAAGQPPPIRPLLEGWETQLGLLW